MADSVEYKGKLLISEPFMMDGNFKRSVVIICDYTKEEGSIGFILNKPIDLELSELVSEFPEIESKVYFGGPVANDTLHYIHNVGDILDNSVEISKGVFWGGDFEKLKFLISNDLIKPHNIKFFIGYSGWSSGQLEDEMEIGSWVIADMDPNYIFKITSNRLWEEILKNKGDIYSVISQVPESNNLN